MMKKISEIILLVSKVILSIIYILLCLYTVTYCSFCSIGFVNDIFYSPGMIGFQNMFLDVSRGMIGFYMPLMLIGGISCLTLVAMYRKMANVYLPLLCSLIPHIIVIFTLRYSPFELCKTPLKYAYWLMIIGVLAIIVYLIWLLIKRVDNKITA